MAAVQPYETKFLSTAAEVRHEALVHNEARKTKGNVKREQHAKSGAASSCKPAHSDAG